MISPSPLLPSPNSLPPSPLQWIFNQIFGDETKKEKERKKAEAKRERQLKLKKQAEDKQRQIRLKELAEREKQRRQKWADEVKRQKQEKEKEMQEQAELRKKINNIIDLFVDKDLYNLAFSKIMYATNLKELHMVYEEVRCAQKIESSVKFLSSPDNAIIIQQLLNAYISRDIKELQALAGEEHKEQKREEEENQKQTEWEEENRRQAEREIQRQTELKKQREYEKNLEGDQKKQKIYEIATSFANKTLKNITMERVQGAGNDLKKINRIYDEANCAKNIEQYAAPLVIAHCHGLIMQKLQDAYINHDVKELRTIEEWVKKESERLQPIHELIHSIKLHILSKTLQEITNERIEKGMLDIDELKKINEEASCAHKIEQCCIKISKQQHQEIHTIRQRLEKAYQNRSLDKLKEILAMLEQQLLKSEAQPIKAQIKSRPITSESTPRESVLSKFDDWRFDRYGGFGGPGD